MQYFSTRDPGRTHGVPLSECILSGAAPDGGLYLPETVPPLPPGWGAEAALVPIATRGLAPYFAGDPLSAELPAIADDALNFNIPLTRLADKLHVLELFHGPTAAFKDVGARFLAACMQRISAADRRRTVLVATSGDTGGAVAAAFYKRQGFDVIILFPEGRVSPLQERQLTCWGENVRSFAVQGNFDDCQRLVKEAFANRDLCEELGLTSANSINIGRLLPQIVYYLQAALSLAEAGGTPPGFIIPSGNLGNATACVVARLMGARIGPVILACNANDTVPEYFATGQWRPRASIATLANAMDVGDPSNMERLQSLYSGDEELRAELSAVQATDAEIRATIRDSYQRWGRAWCPHTATGLYAHKELSESQKAERPWVVVATAHAAKFGDIVEPLLPGPVELPASLAQLLGRATRVESLGAHAEEFFSAIN